MKFAHKLTLALLVVLAVVLSLCNTVLIGQQFRQELHTAQETLSADWQRESRAMQRTLVTPGSGSLAARVGSYLQAITEQNSLACAAYSVDGTSLYYALPTAVPLSEVEALLAQDGEPRMVLANNHTLLCAGTVVLPERCITLVIAQDAAPVWQARQARTRNALIVELLAMVLAGGLVLLLCRRMTRPLEQLEQASRQIAAGAYSQRTAIHGSDEIASLSRSFDEMAQAVEGTVQTLQQNARQKDDFVAAFTHELKTPIALIQGYAEGLCDGMCEDPESRSYYCEVIMDEANKMNKMVKQLLTLSSLESGNDKPVMDRFNLTELVRGVVNASKILLEQNEIQVDFDAQTPVYVWADEFKIEEVFMNFFSNAVNHCEDDKIIEVKMEQKDGKVRVSVFNTGKPIPEDSIHHIWEKFYKVDKARTREYGGSGVGLSIVKAIMESMNQQFGVNNYNNGVEFWFELETK